MGESRLNGLGMSGARFWRLAVLALALATISPSIANAAFPPAKNGRILFTRGVGMTPPDIFVINNDGSGQANLTPGTPEGEFHPVFSPNRKKIVFERVGGVGAIDVWTMNADGKNQVNITAGKLSTAENPTYSPGGKRIALTAVDAAGDQAIYLINADGSNPARVTPPDPAHASFYAPDFSPDGKRLVAYRCAGLSCGISVINIDGSGLQNLTPGLSAGGDLFPEFSPDGKKIVFARDVPPGDADIFAMNADGSGQVPLTSADPKSEGDPSYSPDGTRIAFFRDIAPIGTIGGFVGDLFLANADGTGAADLTAGVPGNEFDPSWEYLFKCRKRKATIVGSAAKETIRGTRKADVIVALGGNDIVKALGGNDYICGGSGKDTIKAGSGNDVVVGEGGADKIIGGPGRDSLKGGKGQDNVVQ